MRRRRDHENGCDLVAIVVVVIVSLQWKCGSEEMPEIFPEERKVRENDRKF